MANNMALSKAEQNALAVSYDVLGSHVELDLQFVKQYLVRGSAELVSDQEIVFFMNTCKMQGLNPLVQDDVYLIKYSKSDPAQMVIGKDAYLRRAFGTRTTSTRRTASSSSGVTRSSRRRAAACTPARSWSAAGVASSSPGTGRSARRSKRWRSTSTTRGKPTGSPSPPR